MFGPPLLLRLFGFSYSSTEKPIEEKPLEEKPLDEKPQEEKKLKPCCACPETKRARDACIVENGQENCTDLIEAHRECMKKMGFNI